MRLTYVYLQGETLGTSTTLSTTSAVCSPGYQDGGEPDWTPQALLPAEDVLCLCTPSSYNTLDTPLPDEYPWDVQCPLPRTTSAIPTPGTPSAPTNPSDAPRRPTDASTHEAGAARPGAEERRVGEHVEEEGACKAKGRRQRWWRAAWVGPPRRRRPARHTCRDACNDPAGDPEETEALDVEEEEDGDDRGASAGHLRAVAGWLSGLGTMRMFLLTPLVTFGLRFVLLLFVC